MKNRLALILLGVLLLIQFVSAQSFTLTDTQPKAELIVGEKEYTVELVSATDLSATFKVTNSEGKSETKEISLEGSTKEINGLSITLKSADETNFKLSVSISMVEVEEEEKSRLLVKTPLIPHQTIVWSKDIN